MAASKQKERERERDYFDIGTPSSSSPSSTPGATSQEWRPQSQQLSGRYQPRRGSTASSIVSVGEHGRLGALRDVSQNGRIMRICRIVSWYSG